MYAAVLGIVGAVAALSPVTVNGSAFYNGSSDRFYIRGVDYQPGGSSNITDPLADVETCKRDIPYFSQLGLNTIRVYTVDNSENHDECMKLLEDNGIYLLLDVNTPKQSLNRLDEDSLKASYNSGYLQHVFATIDAFKNYTNTLGFFAANEVINSENTTIAAPYIKAVVRDMKAYIKAQADRTIPVGYSAADIVTSRWEQMCYLNCGDDEGSRIDMFGMNDYSWCGTGSSFEISGWATNVKDYANYSIPMFLSEYGCNKQSPRQFPEVSSLYSDEMSPVYSGGLVYEYFNEANDYGLVEVNDNKVTTLQDFDNLQSQLAKNPDPTGSAGASTDRQPAQCPSYNEGTWDVKNGTIPAMPSYARSFLKNGAGKGLGLNGPDTQAGSNLDTEDSTSSNSASSSGSSTKSASKSGASSASATKSGSASSSKASGSGSASSSASNSGSSSSSRSSSNGAQPVQLILPASLLALLQYLL